MQRKEKPSTAMRETNIHQPDSEYRDDRSLALSFHLQVPDCFHRHEQYQHITHGIKDATGIEYF